MHIRDLNHRSVCILGFGREGRAVLQALQQHAPEANVTIADQNENLATDDSSIALQLGNDWLTDLHAFDVLIKSPGIPPNPELEACRAKLTNSTQIFLDTVAETGSTIIGITGSKGKSTTASLLTTVLQHSGRDAHLVGNIGIPAITAIDRAAAETVFVVELSSYQLLDLTVSPPIAVVTSFFPEHLDYHGSLEAYKAAKCRIAEHQTEDDHIFFAADNNGAEDIAKCSRGHHHPYTEADAPVALADTNLVGTHNLRNIAGAWRVAEYLGIPKKEAIAAMTHFTGLPHRLQNLGEYHNIVWVDDAISTTPESTMAALQALGDSVDTLICGGQDRGYDFTELGRALANSSVRNLILFPDSGEKIRRSITSDSMQFFPAESMQQAVALAKQHTASGKTCLLSTASPSYNMFKNFEEKGEQFTSEAVN